MDSLEFMEGSLFSKINVKTEEVSSVMSDGDGEHFAGVKFIKLDREGLFRPKMKIKYTGEGIDFQDGSFEELY